MKKKILIISIVLLLIVAFVAGMIWMIYAGHKQEEELQDVIWPEEFMPENVYKTATQTPEIPTPKTIEGEVYKDCTNGFTLTAPGKDYVIKKSGNNIYFRNGTTQIAAIFMADTYDEPIYVWEAISNYVYRLSGEINGKECRVLNYGASNKIDKKVAGFDVKYEHGTFWFDADSDHFIQEEYAYYTIFQGHGFVLIGTTVKDEKTIVEAMDKLLSSLKAYTPTKEDGKLEWTTYQSNEGDKTFCKIPAGWECIQDESGCISYVAPENGNQYDGMVITFMADKDHQYVEDYAQFTNPLEHILLQYCFVQKVKEEDYEYTQTFDVLEPFYKMKEKDCFYAEITDTLFPKTTSVRYSLKTDNTHIRHIRYGYESNGIPCMINFMIPCDNARNVVDTVMESIRLN